MIDDEVGPRPPHQICDRERMDHARRCVKLPRRRAARAGAGRDGATFVVEIMKAAKRIEDIGLEEVEQGLRLSQEPGAVALHCGPARSGRGPGKG